MLNYSQFKTALAEAIRNSFGYDYEVTEGVVAIANEGLLDIISIRHEGSRVAGTVYPKRCFEEYTSGRGVDEIASRLKEDYRISNPEEALQNHVDALSSAENVVEKVFYKMIGIPGNEAYLKDVPYIIPEGFEDIALVPTIPVEMGRDFGTLTVRKFQLQGWNISEAELHAAASANTEKLITVRPLADVIREMMGGDLPEIDNPLYVANSFDERYSASPLGAPKALAGVFSSMGEHYVIPSSIHELFFAPKSAVDPETLKSMVREVNSKVVDPKERLSDNIYECRADGKYITYGAGERVEAGSEKKNDFHL